MDTDRSALPRTARAIARNVRERLVPVSPSGTGKTLIRSSSSRWRRTWSDPARNSLASRRPSQYSIARSYSPSSLITQTFTEASTPG